MHKSFKSQKNKNRKKRKKALKDSYRNLDVAKVLKQTIARHSVISFNTFTNSNDPFIIDFSPKP